jgi:hypothetical protein
MVHNNTSGNLLVSAAVDTATTNSTWISPNDKSTQQCGAGYHGVLCASCDNDRFRLKDVCVVCPELAWMICAVSMSVFFLSVLVYMLFNSEPKQSFFMTKYKVSVW